MYEGECEAILNRLDKTLTEYMKAKPVGSKGKPKKVATEKAGKESKQKENQKSKKI